MAEKQQFDIEQSLKVLDEFTGKTFEGSGNQSWFTAVALESGASVWFTVHPVLQF